MSTTEGAASAPFDHQGMPEWPEFDAEAHAAALAEQTAVVPVEFQGQYGPEHVDAAYQALAAQERRQERRQRGWRVALGVGAAAAIAAVNGIAIDRVANDNATREEAGVTADGQRFVENHTDYVVFEVAQRTVDVDPAKPLVNEDTQVMNGVPNRGRWAIGAGLLDIAVIGGGAMTLSRRRRAAEQTTRQG